jgi:carboxypeptidase T
MQKARVVAIIALALNLLLVGLSIRPGPKSSTAPTQPAEEILTLRVSLRSHADITLLAQAYDLLELRDGNDVFVLGDPDTLDSLQTTGFRVSVHDKTTSGSVRRTAYSYSGGYRTVVEHWAHLDSVATTYPGLARLVDYGDSWRKLNGVPNGHDLRAICLTRLQPGDCEQTPIAPKPRLLLMAAIHARELSTAEVAWRLIDDLTTNYGVDPDITALMDHNETWIIPVANPDGRRIVENAGNGPVTQRKNANTSRGNCASPPSGSSQFGVDLNRNSSWAWDSQLTTSNNPCSLVYRGPAASSEPEVYFVEEMAARLFPDQRDERVVSNAAPITSTGVFITLHSFADQVLLPWSATECFGAPCPAFQRAPNDIGLRALAFRMSHYNGYVTGQSSEVLYATSGSTDDWTYGALGIPSYTYEIGPSSGACDGFFPPYSCQEGFYALNREALLYAIRAARQPYVHALGPTVLSVAISPTIAYSVTDVFTVTATIDDNALGAVGVSRPAAQTVLTAELYIDTPPWAGGLPITMTVADGLADSTGEVFTQVLTPLNIPLGRRLIYVRGIDAAGNPGPLRAVWLTHFAGATQQWLPFVQASAGQ